MPSICTAGRFKGPKVPVCVGLTEGPKAPLTVMPWHAVTLFSKARFAVPHLPAPESITKVVRLSDDMALRDTVEK